MIKVLKPIGILGGTFDPIHFGHLRLGLEIYQSLNLAQVRFIPAFQPVLKSKPQASPEQRLQMVEQAIAGEKAFTVDTCEIQREGPSYTIDTLHVLRTQFPAQALCLILGIDALLSFKQWHKWEEILGLAHLVIAHRPHYRIPIAGPIAELLTTHGTQQIAELSTGLAGKIILQEITALDISATHIRKLIAEGRNPRFLLPESAYHYIHEQKIYTQ